jgi:hypothetical protein
MNDELEKNSEGNTHGAIKVPTPYFLGGAKLLIT